MGPLGGDVSSAAFWNPSFMERMNLLSCRGLTDESGAGDRVRSGGWTPELRSAWGGSKRASCSGACPESDKKGEQLTGLAVNV